jgi:hypothetical protein
MSYREENGQVPRSESSKPAPRRYVLRRSWVGSGKTVNFIMLNPSTADDVFDDATIRRCIGFAKRWGFSSLVVTNLFSYRATQPGDLKELLAISGGFRLAIGDDNAAHLDREAKAADCVVCAWGDNCDVLPHRDLDVIAMLRIYDLFCIRRTAKGNPAHPVRERYTDAPLLFYPKLAAASRCFCDETGGEDRQSRCPQTPQRTGSRW